MDEKKIYKLPKLAYSYDELSAFVSAKQLEIHHTKHHQKYIDDANMILEQLDKNRADGSTVAVKNLAKALSFNIGGHILHSLFWGNIGPVDKIGEIPSLVLEDAIEKEFGSFDNFRTEFENAANTCEGSGWAVLTYCMTTERPVIMQIEKHNNFIIPGYPILLVLDVWEHAYYLDYQNDRKSYVERFWEVINWDTVSARFDDLGVKSERS